MAERVYLGIDYGERRIGLAKSDPTGLIASAYKTIAVKSLNAALREIAEDIAKWQVAGVVVGYPVAEDGGNLGERCLMVDDFIQRLRKYYLGPIYKVDERFSSAEAEQTLHLFHKKIRHDKGRVDRIAAAIILQRFLDERKD
ncbi:MAG: Holliday junction resolvase RuvX [bacterium]|jgi:putative Holliday junction resolvase